MRYVGGYKVHNLSLQTCHFPLFVKAWNNNIMKLFVFYLQPTPSPNVRGWEKFTVR